MQININKYKNPINNLDKPYSKDSRLGSRKSSKKNFNPHSHNYSTSLIHPHPHPPPPHPHNSEQITFPPAMIPSPEQTLHTPSHHIPSHHGESRGRIHRAAKTLPQPWKPSIATPSLRTSTSLRIRTILSKPNILTFASRIPWSLDHQHIVCPHDPPWWKMRR